MKARRLRSLLERRLGYTVDPNHSKGGSHRTLRSPGRPTVTFAFHDGAEVGPHVVRRILVKDVGLTLDEAKEVVRRG
jgi:predicted RNA binding protein YcfA (HicA-like mRNA interferase family)